MSIKSKDYWENRYKQGKNSGTGSRGVLADYKASIVNQLIKEHSIQSVLDFGCGDGYQANLIKCPSYVGVDVSGKALELCSSLPGKTFKLRPTEKAELTLSLDVIFHLTEDKDYNRYIKELFDYSTNLVIIYSTNLKYPGAVPHMRHRRFSEREPPHFTLIQYIPNKYPSLTNSDFYVYQKNDG